MFRSLLSKIDFLSSVLICSIKFISLWRYFLLTWLSWAPLDKIWLQQCNTQRLPLRCSFRSSNRFPYLFELLSLDFFNLAYILGSFCLIHSDFPTHTKLGWLSGALLVHFSQTLHTKLPSNCLSVYIVILSNNYIVFNSISTIWQHYIFSLKYGRSHELVDWKSRMVNKFIRYCIYTY